MQTMLYCSPTTIGCYSLTLQLLSSPQRCSRNPAATWSSQMMVLSCSFLITPSSWRSKPTETKVKPSQSDRQTCPGLMAVYGCREVRDQPMVVGGIVAGEIVSGCQLILIHHNLIHHNSAQIRVLGWRWSCLMLLCPTRPNPIRCHHLIHPTSTNKSIKSISKSPHCRGRDKPRRSHSPNNW